MKKQHYNATENLYRLYREVSITCHRALDFDKSSIVVLGINGGIASGKSTLGRWLKIFITENFPWRTVSMVSTDNFIYSNAYLEKKNLMQKKGFPETYAWHTLKYFVKQIKNQEKSYYKIPVYSHEKKDILQQHFQSVKAADIYVLEGVNVGYHYQTASEVFNLQDTLNLSVYLDTPVEVAKKRAIKRFYATYEKAKIEPTLYFTSLKDFSDLQLRNYVEYLWNNINVPLLEKYIAPGKVTADIVIDALPGLDSCGNYELINTATQCTSLSRTIN